MRAALWFASIGRGTWPLVFVLMAIVAESPRLAELARGRAASVAKGMAPTVIRMLPPLVISYDELDRVIATLGEVLA